MKTTFSIHSFGLSLLLAISVPANAAQIQFTGGTVHMNDGTTVTTDDTFYVGDVDYYEEAGFKLDFISDGGPTYSDSYIGTYYGGGNDVIHGHWDGGCCGSLTRIVVTKIDGSAFNLKSFVLTSNTQVGGGPATGAESAYIHASADGTTESYSQLLPPEDWGFPGTQIVLGSQFGNIKAFWFDVTNAVGCFGMDSFFIDEAPPVLDLSCTSWVSEVGTWGPTVAPCGDLTSTSTRATYESESFFDVFTDFTYEVEFVATRPIQPTAANSLFVRGAPTPRGLSQAWASGYVFGITTTGKYSIFRMSGGIPILVQAWVTPVPPAVINGSGQANILKVEANGGSLTFSINGTPVKTITGQALLSGRVGVGMVRSVPTAAEGPKDTLVVNTARITPGPPSRPQRESKAQEKANEATNFRNATANPFFDLSLTTK